MTQEERVCRPEAKGDPEGIGGGLAWGLVPILSQEPALRGLGPTPPLPSPGLLSFLPRLCAIGHAHPVMGQAHAPVITGSLRQHPKEALLLLLLSELDRGGERPRG